MDEKSGEIMALLDENARVPVAKLANQVGISKQLARYKVNQLEEKGFIKNYRAVLDLGQFYPLLSYVFVALRNGDPKTIETLSSYVLDTLQAVHIHYFEGRYDLVFLVAHKSIEDLDRDLMDFRSTFFDHISELELAQAVGGMRFPRRYRCSGTSKAQAYSGGVPDSTFDKTDIALLVTIRDRAKMTLTDLAHELGISYDQARSRLHMLEKRKVIRGYRTIIDTKTLNLATFEVLIATRNFTPQTEATLKSWCEKNKHVVTYTKLLGKYTFRLIIQIPDLALLQGTLKELRTLLQGTVLSTELLMVSGRKEGDIKPLLENSSQIK